MTFTGVIIWVAIASLALTGGLYFTTKRINNFVLSFLQNFCGILFIFSGWVKAVDPMGTAFKMEQYFAEFQGTFEDTSFNFLAGLFPLLSDYSVGFSVFMIVLEIVIGLMLVLGARAKLASWIFLLLILFFTVLTSFTYLTGYVPSGENFFSFGKWGPYDMTNMRVTDCGCFGDFLTIEPKISFFKDVVLLMPSLIFVFKHSDMHRLFSPKTRNILVGASLIGLIWYCLSNFSWDLPHTDFRPFREGVNIRDQRQAELDATNNVEVVGFVVKNRESGNLVELSTQVYLAEAAKNYPKSDWEVVEQLKTEPELTPTKLSEFIVEDSDGYDISEELLGEPEFRFWIISYKLPYELTHEMITKVDTIYGFDTIPGTGNEVEIVKFAADVNKREEKGPHYNFDKSYLRDYTKELLPLIRESQIVTVGLLGGADDAILSSLQNELDINMVLYKADDILLKTIIRSNPGLMLMKDGVVIGKWHKENLPTVEEINMIKSSSINN